MSRKCWAYPSTLYSWRYKGDGPVGYRVGRHVPGTVGRPSRLGWNSTSTNASNRGAGKSFSSLLAARAARVLRPCRSQREGELSDEPHSKSEPIADTARAGSTLMVASETFTRKAEAERHLAAVEGAKLSRRVRQPRTRSQWANTLANGQRPDRTARPPRQELVT